GLQRDADPLPSLPRLSAHVDPAHDNLSFIERAQTHQALERGRLSSTVWSKQSENFPASDLKAHPAQRFHAIVALGEILDGDSDIHAIKDDTPDTFAPLEQQALFSV
ncbi:MAG TPA: hypothetical protein VEA63_16720, partial [Opitutus sp.]|nr:hypothetical protein [Opitutus sp.]